MPASSLHLDMLFLSGIYLLKKEAFSNLQPVFGYRKKAMPFRAQPDALKFEKRKTLRKHYVCEGLFLSAYQF